MSQCMDEMSRNLSVFCGFTDREYESALVGLNVRTSLFRKDARIMDSGTTTECMGAVLSGCVIVERNDIWGNRTILTQIHPGDVFGETYALLRDTPLLVDVRAKEDSKVQFFQVGHLLEVNERHHGWKHKFMVNLLRISCKKNISLSQRNFHTSPKTVRGRVLAYLNTIAIKTHSHEFDIPFDRQHLADYLNLDRSALSKELGRMRDEGLITFCKNHFTMSVSQPLDQ